MGDFSGAFVGLFSDRHVEVLAEVRVHLLLDFGMAAAGECPEDGVREYGNGEIPWAFGGSGICLFSPLFSRRNCESGVGLGFCFLCIMS